MTTPVPSKLLLQQALDLDNLYRAWEEVRKNRGAAGGDHITLARFERRLELNLLHLAERVQTGTYLPSKVRLVAIYTGQKRREISVWCVADRVLQRAVLQVLEPLFEPDFLPASFGYRPRRSVGDAVRRVLELRDSGYTWVVDADIRDCFLTLDHQLILSLVAEKVMDQDLLDLISLWLPYGRPRSVRRTGEARGISLGGVISPLLCNIYLHQLDVGLARARLQLVRYADDFVVLCRAKWERDQAIDFVTSILDGIRLEVNQTKTRLTTFDEGFTFLGVAFEEHKYRYLWRDKPIEARDQGQTFPLDLDGYWWV
ncbi:MAG: reverse transcriptase domain-containing protein [Dehalococcoidia bacterium]